MTRVQACKRALAKPGRVAMNTLEKILLVQVS